MKIHSVWMWESLENLPLILGFVTAARLWQANPFAGLVVLFAGMGAGILITRSVEPKLHIEKYEVRWINSLKNFMLFSALAMPFLYYFRVENRWLNWKTDLIAGICVGVMLSVGQSAIWRGRKSRIVLHGVAMTVSVPIIMLCLRYIIWMENWGTALLLTILVTLFTSLVITVIDYQEMYRQQNPP